MKPEDAAPFEAAMIALAAVVAGNKELDTPTKRAYWVALEDVPLQPVLGGLELAMKSFDFFPSPHEIRKLADEWEADQRQEFALTPPLAALPAPAEPMLETYDGEWVAPDDDKIYGCLDCRDTGWLHYHCSPETPCQSDLCRKMRKVHGFTGEAWAKRCPCAKIDRVTGRCSNPVIQKRCDDVRAKQGLPPMGSYAKPKPKKIRSFRRYEEDE